MSDLTTAARNAYNHGVVIGERHAEYVTFKDASEARAFLRAIDTGEEIEIGPRAILSGEWADDPSPADILRANAGERHKDLSPEDEDYILCHFTDAYDEGWWNTVVKTAKTIAGR
jgi:hypothetical protein